MHTWAHLSLQIVPHTLLRCVKILGHPTVSPRQGSKKQTCLQRPSSYLYTRLTFPLYTWPILERYSPPFRVISFSHKKGNSMLLHLHASAAHSAGYAFNTIL